MKKLVVCFLVTPIDSTSEIQGNEIPLDPGQWSNFAGKYQVKTVLINREGFVIVHKILHLVCIVLIIDSIFSLEVLSNPLYI